MRKARFGIPFGLVALALLMHPSMALAASTGIAKQWSNVCDVPILKQLCDLGNTVTSGVSSVSSGITQDLFSSLVSWIAGAAAWVLDHVVAIVQSSAAVNLNGAWFQSHYMSMATLSAFVMLPILAIAVIKAAFTGEGGQLALAVFLYLPFSIVGIFIAVPLVNLVIGSVDWASNVASASLNADYNAFIQNISTAIGGHGGAPLVAGFVALISSIFIVILGIMLIVVLMARNAAIYIVAALIPFALAPIVLPGMGGIAKKLFAYLAGTILIKFVIVLSIAIGVAALGAGNTCDPNGQACGSFSTVLAAIAIFSTAIVLPYNIINMIIIQPLLSGPAAMATILGGGINAARSAAMIPMGTSDQIYANIRHNTHARLGADAFATRGAGVRVPRAATSAMAGRRAPANVMGSAGGAATRAAGGAAGSVTSTAPSGGGLSGTTGGKGTVSFFSGGKQKWAASSVVKPPGTASSASISTPTQATGGGITSTARTNKTNREF